MENLPAYFSGFLAILLFSSFVKIFTSLHILRAGIGIHGGAYGVVILALSLALSLVVMAPQLQDVGGVEAVLSGSDKVSVKLEDRFRPFLEKHAHADVQDRLFALSEKLHDQPAAAAKDSQPKEPAQPAAVRRAGDFPVLVASFLVSELQEAFQLGVMFLIPFVVIDLLTMNILTALGVVNLSAAVVAFPLKLLLFFAVDGWALVAGKLIGGYAQ